MGKNKIAIIGSGAMASAVGKVLFDAGHKDISVYGIDESELEELSNGFNTKYFSNASSLPHFKTTSDIKVALEGANYLVFAVPSHAAAIVLSEILPNLSEPTILLSVIKGFFPQTNLSVHQALLQKTKVEPLIKGVVSLAGPAFASEIVQGLPTLMSLVGKDKSVLHQTQNLFRRCKYFKTNIENDTKGAEVGAIYKNIIAIGAGIIDASKMGANFKCSFLTKSLQEIKVFAKVMGAKKETINGITGLGDLILTSSFNTSRNFSFGKELVQNYGQAFKSKKTVEGLVSLKTVHNIMTQNNLDLPVAKGLYKVIYQKGDPQDFVKWVWNMFG